MSRTLSWFLAAAVCVARTASADDRPMVDGNAIQNGIGIEVGAIYEGGHTEYGENVSGLAPSVQGLVLRDRNGMTSRMVIGLLIAVAGALAQSSAKSTTSESHVEGNYLVTTTTTTYYSEAAKAAMRESTNRAIDGLFTAHYSDFELHVFGRDRFGRGDSTGYHLNFLVGDGSKTFGYETGFGFGKVDSLVASNGTTARLDWKYFGMPFRLTYLAGPLRFALTYEWNWLKYGVDYQTRTLHLDTDNMTTTATTVSHPWHLDASTVIAHRVLVMGGVTTQVLATAQLGYYLSAGFLF